MQTGVLELTFIIFSLVTPHGDQMRFLDIITWKNSGNIDVELFLMSMWWMPLRIWLVWLPLSKIKNQDLMKLFFYYSK